VRELRKFLGWSQEKLAIASDCKREYIGKIERKITDPQVSNLENIIENGFQISHKEFHDYETIPETIKKRKEYETKKKSVSYYRNITSNQSIFTLKTQKT
jgi:transcriptional regulator with XRE-family HTH domain